MLLLPIILGGGDFSQILLDAINAGGNAGILFSAAAGNANNDNDAAPQYPASYNSDTVIAVAATDHNDAIASFSNYGVSSVDLAAPGVNILSTIISSASCVVTPPALINQGFEAALDNSWSFYATTTNNTPPYFSNPVLEWQRDDLDAATGIYSFSDSISGDYVNNLISSAGQGPFDLSTLNNACFSFKIKGENEAFFDQLSVYVSGDNGASWSSIGSTDVASYPDWTQVGFLIPADKLTSQFKYAVVRTSDSSVVRAGYEVDDIAIGSGTTFHHERYDSFSGTSMATPHVSAAIALAAEAFPNETLLERRNRLLNNVDPIPALAGVVATGGRLNLYNMVLGAPSLAGIPFSAGSIFANHVFSRKTYSGDFSSPVIIAGPATRVGSDPGAVRIKNINNAAKTFDIAFKEWDYLDGFHATEAISVLVAESGRYQQGDVIIEVGTFQLSGTGSFNTVNFSASFPGIPQVYLTAQSSNGSQVVTVRAKDVNADSFKAALFEQESLMDGHVGETIGYFAIYSPSESGTFADNLGNNISFSKTTKSLTHVDQSVFGASFFIEEEQSADAEINHMAENVDVLYIPWFGADLRFAQQTTIHGSDPSAVRIK